ncbi:MAG: LLM class flavin-dependent oxidoreductase [Microbacterium sp.]|nr:LLM class flavin-dependent oxidoreductase [Microbacterium sp.]
MFIGYHASHEQVPPSALLTCVQRAEAAGFDGAMCSDHYAPWSTASAAVCCSSVRSARFRPARCTNVTGKFDHDVVLVASS